MSENNKQKLDVLCELTMNGSIKGYEIVNVDENGVVGKESEFRNRERLKIILHDNKTIIVDAFCSGCSENTTLVISVN